MGGSSGNMKAMRTTHCSASAAASDPQNHRLRNSSRKTPRSRKVKTTAGGITIKNRGWEWRAAVMSPWKKCPKALVRPHPGQGMPYTSLKKQKLPQAAAAAP